MNLVMRMFGIVNTDFLAFRSSVFLRMIKVVMRMTGVVNVNSLAIW